ncbi:MAG: hypothetical protein ABSF65_01005 [Candidatus Bathyarchaeia archaeon]|jgi:hypothetical protein
MPKCAFLVAALFLLAMITLLGAAFAQSSVVGVKAGDWIRYSVKETGTPISEYNITWASMNITNVQGEVITVNVLTQYGNGTLLPESDIHLNVATGAIGDGFFVPTDLKPGDRYSTEYEGIINMTTVEKTQAGGATRDVLVGVTSQSIYNWDTKTGIMVAATSNLPGCVMHTTTSSTNLWLPQILGLNQTVFYALLLSTIGLAAVLAGAVLLLIMRRKKQINLIGSR